MKAFIAGGAGFVGQHLTRHLESLGYTVFIYDKNLPANGAGVCADIRDIEMLISAMQGMDVVYHLASNADICKAATEPTIDFYQGTKLTQNILEAMRIAGVKRLVYFSGSGVYGDLPHREFDENFGPLMPISTYGASKLACEALICAYCHMFGLAARVLRPANIVGSGQTHGIGYDFVRKLQTDPTRLTVLGDGTQLKNYLHIKDVIEVLYFLTYWEKGGFDAINVSGRDSMSVADIAKAACTVMGCPDAKIIFTGGSRGWAGDVPRITMSSAKLNRRGWIESMTSAQAITLSMEEMKNEITAQS